ncbi:MAG: VOC family protein [Gemmataceae bacterium]
MKIQVTGIFVDDQAKALKFYTEILGFQKKEDIPVSEEHRWLTVVSSEAPDGAELLLEPNVHQAAKAYQAAIFQDGIPANMFFVDDLQAEFERLKQLGVTFKTEPTQAGPVTMAVFDDTCGNLIQLVEQ